MRHLTQLCVEDLMSKIREVPEFAQKAFYVYTLEQLESPTIGLSYPCAGVVYESLRTMDSGKAGGLQAELSCLVVVFVYDRTLGVDLKYKATALLDSIRDAIKKTRSPTGHNWKFTMESPFPVPKAGVLAYGQRWVTAAPLDY